MLLTPSPCHKLSHLLEPPPHLGGLVKKTQTKTPCTNTLSIVRGVLSGGFVRGCLVWKVLSGVVFVHSPFCQNTSVTTES